MGPSDGHGELGDLPIGSSYRCETSFTKRRLTGYLISLQTLICLVLFLNSQVFAQTSSTGALLGAVVDASGASLPEASVEVKDQALTISRSAQCDADGRFLFPLLPPGTYQVTAQKDGFAQAQSI